MGPIETKVREDIAALITTHAMAESLAAVAISLARSLDSDSDIAVHSVAKELRATLNDLAREGVDDDSDLDALLSTPVRDSEDS